MREGTSRSSKVSVTMASFRTCIWADVSEGSNLFLKGISCKIVGGGHSLRLFRNNFLQVNRQTDAEMLTEIYWEDYLCISPEVHIGMAIFLCCLRLTVSSPLPSITGSPSVSGISDMDYPLQGPGFLSIPCLPEISSIRRVPLPHELVEQFGRILILILMKYCALFTTWGG